VLKENFNSKDTFKILNNDGSIWYKFSFNYDDSDGEYDFYNSNFEPFAFHQDYYLLVFAVMDSFTREKEIIVNQTTGLRKKIADITNLEFMCWDSLLTNKVFSISYDPNVTSLKKEPTESSTNIEDVVDSELHPIKIKGDWLGVESIEDGKFKGWIR